MRFDPDNKKSAERNSEVIFENDRLLFIKCLSRTCFSYYARNTVYRMWVEYFDRRGSDLYLLIQKDDNGSVYQVWSILKPENMPVMVRDDFNEHSWAELVSTFPEIKDKLYETFSSSDLYEALKRISEGFEYDKYSLNRIEDCVTGIKFNTKNPQKSFINLNFTDDEYLSIFYGSNDDNVNFYGDIQSGYYEYTFDDISSTESDWKEGYLSNVFNNDNKEKYKKIVEYISPYSLQATEFDEIFNQTVTEFSNMFKNETDSIIEEYHSIQNECRRDGIIEGYNDEFCEKLLLYGIVKNGGCFNRYVTTVRTLLNMYEKTNSQGFSLIEMLRNFVTYNNLDDNTNYYDNQWDYFCKDWATNRVANFNTLLSDKLDSCLESLESDDTFKDIDEYKKIISVISKYGLNKWNPIPHSQNNNKFMIIDTNPKTNKIYINVLKGNKTPLEQRSYTLDEFNNFLNSPELFD